MGNRSNSIKKNTTEQKSIAIGLNKGFVTTEIKKTEKQAKKVQLELKRLKAGLASSGEFTSFELTLRRVGGLPRQTIRPREDGSLEIGELVETGAG